MLDGGPVNQNDIGKQFYGFKDLLCGAHPDKTPTSMIVWTLKAKTIADPLGNEEQLLNPRRKGALVDLRPAPHDVVSIHDGTRIRPFRKEQGRTSEERAFAARATSCVVQTENTFPEIQGAHGHVRWPMLSGRRRDDHYTAIR